ncbi:hypothetical protein DFQ05_0937 [Winogradskyella wandonensis]|uniref:Uncharacterized protein n=1 Tax=Winogradskyella wandonensis TaxID=1442586 RepID=A0A4R1KW25_9FLAO|nr:hypothetical protein [Winogradskyella wandonensis]TCK69416.1 hypothetical protein DFQ05_0937 [Winogradskyella wandonensis]
MIITPTLVILMAIVFILLFLFLKTVDNRKWLVFLISLVLTPLTYFYVVYPFINIVSSYHHQKYFNSEAWLEKPALRYEMIDSTIETDTLKGKTKTEIETLLGKAEWLTWDDEKKAHDTNKWNYGLGIEPGAFTDEKSNVEISFKNNKVASLKTYTEPIIFDTVED